MAVTIKDVAKKAGVSYSTVSRALNDPNADKSDKKKRILKIAEEKGDPPFLFLLDWSLLPHHQQDEFPLRSARCADRGLQRGGEQI